ncbi:ABC transporter permease [Peptoniphilus gorbachii]|uniref:Simple sugar transport system permease protein n=1 Tax=Peptoniphilus gorbachii TaxID=411567 RepID=A0ABS2MLT1_9FIRM|nr:ABC transporter permease [Peptoniphilus gorbachii]MBS4882588.1 ABC transporter permease [Peptoniphilus harei]MBM7550981.1 simple sugar transport system permease protein [Peptoniphilus gorbachii]MBS5946008.1 ABC transporter permease [Peptoniphilus harei]MDU1663596.1 ABC transporter permease [Peptoniphilus harei]MDU5570995.1 ABC transporter permease [Peptoniphilus harei]
MKRNRFLYTVLAIILGILIGSIILLVSGTNPIEAYKVIFFGAFGKPKYISWTIVKAVPLILTGLSVAFAFNTGLFNIGAEGQYIVGSIGALVVGLLVDLPPVLHGLVALLAGALCGYIWGAIVGILKAKFEVNEVISSIMMNWIGFYLSNYLLSFPILRNIESDNSYSIKNTASIKILGAWKTSEAGRAVLANNKFLRDILNPPVNFGIIIAIVAALVIWYILKKTTLGYELRAVGFNDKAAEYGGISINKSIVTSMGIAGILAGLAGAITVLGVSGNIGIMAGQEGYGFDGMAVALIAGNNPLGTIPAALLYAGLTYGGGKLTTIGTYSEVVKIIVGIMILFIAMPKLLDMIRFFSNKWSKKDPDKVNKGGANE